VGEDGVSDVEKGGDVDLAEFCGVARRRGATAAARAAAPAESAAVAAWAAEASGSNLVGRRLKNNEE